MEECCEHLLQAFNITAFQQEDIFGPSGPLALAVQAVVCDYLQLGFNSTSPGNSSGLNCSQTVNRVKGPGMP